MTAPVDSAGITISRGKTSYNLKSHSAMIPRTLKMAAYVQSTLTAPQYTDYGNVILNGYLTTASAVVTAGARGAINAVSLTTPGSGYTNATYTGVYLGGVPAGSWGYATVVVAGGVVTTVTITSGGQNFTVGQVLSFSLPGGGTGATITITSVNTRSTRPVLKGWTNQSPGYFTELPVNAYGVYPGAPNSFEFIVHSFKPPTGAVAAIYLDAPAGSGYTNGTYTNVATVTGTYGTGATLDIVVSGGQVQSVVINNPGTDYRPNSTLTTAAIGPGTGFYVVITAVSGVSQNGNPYWSQRPILSPGSTGGNGLPPFSGFIYPVPDSPVPPPIGTL